VLAEPKARNEKMRDELNELEMQTVELMDDLNQEFERLFQELVDSTKQAIATYFSTIRDLEIVYFEAVTANVRARSPAGASHRRRWLGGNAVYPRSGHTAFVASRATKGR
jgi:hypothetical protein